MSFVLTFSPPGMDSDLYDQCIKKLKDAGAGSPKGRTSHVAYGDPKNLTVSDIWESMEDFQAFGNTLMPVLQSLGIDPGQPTPLEIHNYIKG